MNYSKPGSIAGINRQKIASHIRLLEYPYLIYLVKPFTKNIDKEISQQPKLYFADAGILNTLAGSQISGGQLFENCMPAQLKPLGELQYYQRKTGQEIDFIFTGKTAVEVKETAIKQDKQVLSQRASFVGIKKTNRKRNRIELKFGL